MAEVKRTVTLSAVPVETLPGGLTDSRAVYIARHVQSKWNCATKEQREAATEDRSLRDADISPGGMDQLRKIAANPRPKPVPIKTIYCSPLTRAIRTAQVIS